MVKGRANMKNIPDFDIELSQAIDYIMESPLAKKAFSKSPFPQYTNVLRILVQSVDRLADNCHMPEFTNHALPHICSIVRRASIWAVEDKWIDKIESNEAGYLLLALIVHDIGMLSQDASDLPQENKSRHMKGFSDISNWVRRTHVLRIHGLVLRLLQDEIREDLELGEHLQVVICMAESHQKWPWESEFVSNQCILEKFGLDMRRMAAFNAVIAVCDLLDEDANRCDTLTLIKYRHGTTENMAHWIRHALTVEVDGVREHTVRVTFRKLLPEKKRFEKIYRALRNHYRLVQLYNEQLTILDAEIKHMVFSPSDGNPEYEDGVTKELSSIWVKLPEFKDCIVEQLLSTFMPEALGVDNGNPDMRRRLDKIGLERMDLSKESRFIMPQTVCYPEEKILSAGGDFKEKLTYIKNMVEEAYLDGQIGKIRHLCYIAWEIWNSSVSLNDIYWVFIYLSIFEKYGDEYSILMQEYTNPFIPGRMKDSHNKLLAEGDYSYLLDVWFMFLQPCVSEEWMEKFETHIRKCNYQNMKEDFASILLLKNLIGMFWYFEQEGECWRRIANYLLQSLSWSAVLVDELQSYISQLEMQNKILFRTEKDVVDIRERDKEPLAKAWMDYWNEDWAAIETDIPQLCVIANRNKDFIGSVQGYLNMVQWGIKIAKWRKEKYGEEGNEEVEKDNIDNEEVIGRFRYSRIQLEQPRPSFWQQRDLVIESLFFDACGSNQKNSGYDRCRALRLISLQMLEALQYWDLIGYLDAIHNETKLHYLLGTYLDENGEYKGMPEYLTICLISYIRGINEKELHEQERRMAAEYLMEFTEDAEQELSIITEFITERAVRIQWKCALCVVEVFAEFFTIAQRKQLLHWLAEYHQYYKRQNSFFDSGQYLFLKKWVKEMDFEDWEVIAGLLDEIFINQHIMMTNIELVNGIFQDAPWQKAIRYLQFMQGYPDNVRKSSDLYSAIIILSNREDADKEFLHEIVAQLIQSIEQRKNAEEDCASEQWEKMLYRYQRVRRLIDAENLYELEPVDLDEMNDLLDELETQIRKRGNLSGYDSRFMDSVGETFCNQNWSGGREEKVLIIIDRIISLMQTYRFEMSDWFFHDFCVWLRYIGNSGTEEERRHIVQFVMEEMVHKRFLEEKKQDKNNLLNNFQFNLGSRNQYLIDVTLLLVTCMREISQEHRPDAIIYMIHAMDTDEIIIYNYGMVMFSYYYLMGGERERLLSWGGLQAIRGRLRITGKTVKEIREKLQNAVTVLGKSDVWFGEKGFREYAEEDVDYKDFIKSIKCFI